MPASQLYRILKAQGLHLLNLQPRFGQHDINRKVEPPKPVIESSRWAIAARLSIHLLPALTSIVIITLNLNTLYLGRQIPGPLMDDTITNALLQICAKLQEMLVVASLTTIVFDVVRGELLAREGVPLRFLCAGFMFGQINFFWSPEFWGSVGAPISRRARLALVALLALCGLVAATAGPASAVLLVPRSQDWSAGGSDYYLRGNRTELFPDIVAGSSANSTALCLGPDSINYGFCPAGGFTSLVSYGVPQQMVKNGDNFRPPAKNVFGPFGSQVVQISSVTAGVPASEIIGTPRGIICQTAVVAPYLPAMMYASPLSYEWGVITGALEWDAAQPWMQKYVELIYNSGGTWNTQCPVPNVRTACSAAQNVSSTDTAILFPVLPEYLCPSGTEIFTVLSLNNTPSSTLRVSWTDLPAQFGTTSKGMIFEAPWLSDGSSRLVVGCSVDARWANGTVDATYGQGTNDETSSSSVWWPTSHVNLESPFRPPPDKSWHPIALNDQWLRMLAPYGILSSKGDVVSNMSSFEIILNGTGIIDSNLTEAPDQTAFWNSVTMGTLNRTLALEWMTSLLISDGLSRYGTSGQLDLRGDPSTWGLLDYSMRPDYVLQMLEGGTVLYPPSQGPYTTWFMAATVQGLSYRAHSVTDYLAISILLLHILLALMHVAYVLRIRKSFSAWDSITEMLVLAYNSSPSAGVLRNASAGIRYLDTFRTMATVRVSRSVEEADGDEDDRPVTSHLELIFAESSEPNEPVDTGQELSTLPRDHPRTAATARTWPGTQLDGVGSSIPVPSTTVLRPRSRDQHIATQPLLAGSSRSTVITTEGECIRLRGRVSTKTVLAKVNPDQEYS